jgi:hypothetical protein
LTEEEESLAQEEESLKKEIEETESLSIDEELQRRVILDFSDVNIESDWKSVVDEWAVDSGGEEEADLAREAAVETPKLTQNSCRFRQPGELVQIHQRLLSPLRKRYGILSFKLICCLGTWTRRRSVNVRTKRKIYGCCSKSRKRTDLRFCMKR